MPQVWKFKGGARPPDYDTGFALLLTQKIVMFRKRITSKLIFNEASIGIMMKQSYFITSKQFSQRLAKIFRVQNYKANLTDYCNIL